MNQLPVFDSKAYTTALTKLLSAWKPTIKAELTPHPVHVQISGGGEKAYEYNQYTIIVTITQSSLSDRSVEVSLMRKESEFDLNPQRLWRDAYEVQDKYYDELKLPRGNVDSTAPYWQLWEEAKTFTKS